MSLLLDALKRAEQEKLAKQGDRPANDEKARPAATPSLELHPVQATPVPSHTPATSGRSEAEATQNVFQAKAGSTSMAAPQRKSSMLWAVVGGIAIVILAAGAYVWYAVQTLRPQVAASTRTRPASPPRVPILPGKRGHSSCCPLPWLP